MSNSSHSAALDLRRGITTLEDFDSQIDEANEVLKALKAQRKAVMNELKAAGFLPKAVTAMLSERRMEVNERRLYHATLQTYRAMLGMLDGTPLGDAARREFEKSKDPRRPPPDKSEKKQQADPSPVSEDDVPLPFPVEAPPADAETGPLEADIGAAREQGCKAARAGQSVTANPYPAAKEVLRAAWDEGWCSECGSDGMDIPKELRRPEKGSKRKGGGSGDEEREAA